MRQYPYLYPILLIKKINFSENSNDTLISESKKTEKSGADESGEFLNLIFKITFEILEIVIIFFFLQKCVHLVIF